MGLTHSRVSKPQSSSNPMFGAKQLNRDTDSVQLTPNIKLAVLPEPILPALSARNVRVNPPLDLRNTLLVAEDHLHNHDDAANHNGGDGYQKRAQAENRIHKPIHAPLLTATNDPNSIFSGGADRDRTGGLLVANQALSQLSYSPNCSVQCSVASGQKNVLSTDH